MCVCVQDRFMLSSFTMLRRARERAQLHVSALVLICDLCCLTSTLTLPLLRRLLFVVVNHAQLQKEFRGLQRNVILVHFSLFSLLSLQTLKHKTCAHTCTVRNSAITATSIAACRQVLVLVLHVELRVHMCSLCLFVCV